MVTRRRTFTGRRSRYLGKHDPSTHGLRPRFQRAPRLLLWLSACLVLAGLALYVINLRPASVKLERALFVYPVVSDSMASVYPSELHICPIEFRSIIDSHGRLIELIDFDFFGRTGTPGPPHDDLRGVVVQTISLDRDFAPRTVEPTNCRVSADIWSERPAGSENYEDQWIHLETTAHEESGGGWVGREETVGRQLWYMISGLDSLQCRVAVSPDDRWGIRLVHVRIALPHAISLPRSRIRRTLYTVQYKMSASPCRRTSGADWFWETLAVQPLLLDGTFKVPAPIKDMYPRRRLFSSDEQSADHDFRYGGNEMWIQYEVEPPTAIQAFPAIIGVVGLFLGAVALLVKGRESP